MMMMNSGLYTYGLNGVWKGDEHPAYAPLDYGHPLPLPLYDTDKSDRKTANINVQSTVYMAVL